MKKIIYTYKRINGKETVEIDNSKEKDSPEQTGEPKKKISVN